MKRPTLRHVSPLVKKLATEVRSKDESALDEIIHDIYSSKASEINNNGVEAQIQLILDEDGVDAGTQVIRGAIQ